MNVYSLPKTVTRQRRECDLNPGPTAPESSMLTTLGYRGTQYNHVDTVGGRSVQFLLQCYECTGPGSLQITATRLHQTAPNHIQNSKSFPGATPPDLRRLEARPSDPRPGLEK